MSAARESSTADAAAAAGDVGRTIRHVVAAVDAAVASDEPFHHLRLDSVFPAELYSAMLDAMPASEDYREMSGRARTARTGDGRVARTKIDLFPEQIRHLRPEKRPVWETVGRALRSTQVREAFVRRLAPGLERRFGPDYARVGMYAVPILTRDVPGYRIGIHADTRRKGMTIQLYLPRDRSIEHVGTVFHERTGEAAYREALRMPFLPNTGYAFAVGPDTHHSVDPVGAEVRTRDSILLTYFVDETLLQLVHNRGKRLGNFVLAELRGLG